MSVFTHKVRLWCAIVFWLEMSWLCCVGLRLAMCVIQLCFGWRDDWATIWFELGVSWFEIDICSVCGAGVLVEEAGVSGCLGCLKRW